MLLFGHDYVESAHFYHIFDVQSISKTPSNALLLVTFAARNLDIINYMRNNALGFGIEVASLQEAIFAENLGAKFIITQESCAASIQKCADHYLFDAKVLCRIEDDDAIERLALEGIDGIIYPEAIIKI